MPASREVLTIEEAARYLRLGKRTLYDLVRQHKVPAALVGGKWLFPRASLETWLREQAAQQVSEGPTGTVQRLLEIATNEASRMGASRVGGEHLLIAISRQPSPAAALLHSLGLTADKLREVADKTFGRRVSSSAEIPTCTPRVEKILEKAEASSRTPGEVAIEDVLRAVLAENGTAHRLLSGAGIDKASIEAMLSSLG